MAAQDYENLMFLNWRRCGTYYYKPDHSKSCCKLHAIRLEVEKYMMNKNQKKAMKKFNKYLAGEDVEKDKMDIDNNNANSVNKLEKKKSNKNEDPFALDITQFIQAFLTEQLKISQKIEFKVVKNKNQSFGDYSVNVLILLFHLLKKNNMLNYSEEILKDMQSFSSFMVNTFLQENKNWKLSLVEKSGYVNFTYINREEIAEYNKKEDEKNNKNNLTDKKEKKNVEVNDKKVIVINEINEAKDKKDKDSIENKSKKETKDSTKDSTKDYTKEIKIKQDNKNNKMDIEKNGLTQNLNNNNTIPKSIKYFEEYVPNPVPEQNLKRKYTIELESANKYTDEKYNIYKKYQIAIHKDQPNKLSPNGFKNFLGNAQFNDIKKFDNTTNPIFPDKFGGYHMLHRIDGKLFAVGVIDILPTSISAVYLFYDPDYGFLNPGIVTGVREIEFVREIKKSLIPEMKYYVMGYYIHTCQKMRYKGDFFPSQILCPVSHNFVDLKSVEKILEENKFQKLTDEKKNDFIDIPVKDRVNIMKGFKVKYFDQEFNLMDFLQFFNNPNYQKVITKNLTEFIDNAGKTVLNVVFIGDLD